MTRVESASTVGCAGPTGRSPTPSGACAAAGTRPPSGPARTSCRWSPTTGRGGASARGGSCESCAVAAAGARRLPPTADGGRASRRSRRRSSTARRASSCRPPDRTRRPAPPPRRAVASRAPVAARCPVRSSWSPAARTRRRRSRRPVQDLGRLRDLPAEDRRRGAAVQQRLLAGRSRVYGRRVEVRNMTLDDVTTCTPGQRAWSSATST